AGATTYSTHGPSPWCSGLDSPRHSDCMFFRGCRGAAASTLAWVGRLDLVVADLSSLTHQQALDVVARPYLGRDKNGPLNYSPLERVLDAHPMLHDELVTRLSPTSMYGIDADDLPAAMSGLSSRWAFVRRHASIVLLSVHV
ncbi:hypothetical protein, partial [Gordonia aichiensis]